MHYYLRYNYSFNITKIIIKTLISWKIISDNKQWWATLTFGSNVRSISPLQRPQIILRKIQKRVWKFIRTPILLNHVVEWDYYRGWTLTLEKLLEFLVGHRMWKVSDKQLLVVRKTGAPVARVIAGARGPLLISLVDRQFLTRRPENSRHNP